MEVALAYRIYQIAKSLNLSTKAVKLMMKNINIEAKSHMSRINNSDIQKFAIKYDINFEELLANLTQFYFSNNKRKNVNLGEKIISESQLKEKDDNNLKQELLLELKASYHKTEIVSLIGRYYDVYDFKGSYNFYTELFYKFNTYEDLKELMDNMTLTGAKTKDSFIFPLIRAQNSEFKLFDLYSEIKQKNLISSIKIIDAFIRKIFSFNLIMEIIKDVKFLGLELDHRLIDYIISKFNKNINFNCFYEEIGLYDNANAIIEKIREKSVLNPDDFDLLTNDYIFMIIVNKVTKLSVLTRLLENSPNNITTIIIFSLLRKLKNFEFSNSVLIILENYILPNLNNEELSHFLKEKKLTFYAGKQKLYSKMFNLSESLKKRMDNIDNPTEYMNIAGQESVFSNDLRNYFIEKIMINNLFDEFKFLEIEDIFQMEIKYNEGKMHSIKQIQEIIQKIKSKKHPALLLIFSQDLATQRIIRFACLTNLLVEISNTNDLKFEINSFKIFNILESMEHFVKNINFERYDVNLIHFYKSSSAKKIKSCYDNYNILFSQYINSFKINLHLQTIRKLDVTKYVAEMLKKIEL